MPSTAPSEIGEKAPSTVRTCAKSPGDGAPFSADNTAESLSGLVNRVDSGATPGYTTTPATVGSAGAQYGIWCAHLVLNTTDAITFGPNGNLQFNASASIKDIVANPAVTDQRISTFTIAVPVPAPGALALLGVAGFASRRRRA
jgi:MYXO-CTERM domain-containing protein